MKCRCPRDDIFHVLQGEGLLYSKIKGRQPGVVLINVPSCDEHGGDRAVALLHLPGNLVPWNVREPEVDQSHSASRLLKGLQALFPRVGGCYLVLFSPNPPKDGLGDSP